MKAIFQKLKTQIKGGLGMVDTIDVHDLPEEQANLLQEFVEFLRQKARLTRPRPITAEEAFKRAAGRWKGTINAEELIKNIYADRLISTRPEVKL
jgi:hypothetical protein